jgi:hypothetical protein
MAEEHHFVRASDLAVGDYVGPRTIVTAVEPDPPWVRVSIRQPNETTDTLWLLPDLWVEIYVVPDVDAP